MKREKIPSRYRKKKELDAVFSMKKSKQKKNIKKNTTKDINEKRR